MASACEGIDTVFHTAALAGIWGPWREYYGINTLGTQHIIAGCQGFGVKYLVYTSSPSVTFDGSNQINVDEAAAYPYRWLANYPKSKALAEQDVIAANNVAEGNSSLQTCCLRPHLIWGPRDHHLIPRLIDRARKGQLRRVGDGSNLVDTIYVENAANAHLQAAQALATTGAPAGKVYFLSQGEPVNLWGWIDQILALANLPPVKKSISARAAYFAGSVLESIWTVARKTSEPRMTRFLAAQLATSHYFDISAAREDFGYEPVVSMSEGMRRLASELAGEAITQGPKDPKTQVEAT